MPTQISTSHYPFLHFSTASRRDARRFAPRSGSFFLSKCIYQASLTKRALSITINSHHRCVNSNPDQICIMLCVKYCCIKQYTCIHINSNQLIEMRSQGYAVTCAKRNESTSSHAETFKNTCKISERLYFARHYNFINFRDRKTERQTHTT